jgi:hypothetical protein
MHKDRTSAEAVAALLLVWSIPLLTPALREGGVAALVLAALVAAGLRALPPATPGPWAAATDRWLPLVVAAALLGRAVEGAGPGWLGVAALAWLAAPSLPADRRVAPALALAGVLTMLGPPLAAGLPLGWTLLTPRWSMSTGTLAAAVLLGALGALLGPARGEARRHGGLLAVAVVMALAWEADPRAAAGSPVAGLLLACAALPTTMDRARTGPSPTRAATLTALLGAALTAWFALTPTALPTLMTLTPLAAAGSRLPRPSLAVAAPLLVLVGALAAWPGLPSGIAQASTVALTAGALVWAIGLTGLFSRRGGSP